MLEHRVVKINTNGEKVRLWKELVVLYFKLLCHHPLERMGKIIMTSFGISGIKIEIRKGHLLNTRQEL
jgi:hypothetical protein